MTDSRAPKRQWIRWLIPVATLALLGLFARSVDWPRAWSAIAHANPLLLAFATLVNLLSLTVKGIRWSVFLEGIGVRGVGAAVRATFVAAALNNVVVANGGEAARVAGIARQSDASTTSVLATLAVDRLCDLLTYAVLFVATAFVLPLPADLARWRMPGLVAIVAIVSVIAFLLWRAPSPADAGGVVAKVERSSLLVRARRSGRELLSTTASIATPKRVALAAVLSIISWIGQWATYHYAAHSAAFAMTPTDTLLAWLAVNASFLIRLTPGNVGVFQLLYALAATSTGLSRDSAVAVAFLIQVIQYIPVTIVGLLFAPSLAAGPRARIVAPTPPRIDREPAMRLRGEQERGA
jgi:uncharacterized protein (TIRG00374 family)